MSLASNAGLVSGLGIFSVALSNAEVLDSAGYAALSPAFENAIHDRSISSDDDEGDVIDIPMRPEITLDRIISPGDTQREWAVNARRFIEVPLREVDDGDLPEALEYIRCYEACREPDTKMISGARQYLEGIFNVAALKERLRNDSNDRLAYADTLWDSVEYAKMGELISLEAAIGNRGDNADADLIKRRDELRDAIEIEIREGIFEGLTDKDCEAGLEFEWRDGLLEGAAVRAPTHAVIRRLFESKYVSFLNGLSLRRSSPEAFRTIVAMPEMSRLRRLDLSEAAICDEGMRNFARAARHFTNLRVLNLRGNIIGDAAMRHFAEAAGHLTNLRELNLGVNFMGAVGMEYFARAAAHLTNLRVLNLRGNIIGDAGMEYFARAAAHLTNLRVLDLGGNGINDEGMEYFARVIEYLTNLRVLDLGDNSISDEVMKFYYGGVYNLQAR